MNDTLAPHVRSDVVDVVHGIKYADGKAENEPQGPMEVFRYVTGDPLAHARFTQIAGLPMGFVNRTDLDRLLQTMTHAAAGYSLNMQQVPLLAFGVKHGNACGGAWGVDGARVLESMLEGDLQAIFGGFVMTNFEIDSACAEVLIYHKCEGKRLLDGIVAPFFTAEARDILESKSGRRRLIENPALEKLDITSLDSAPHRTMVRGGHLKQKSPTYVPYLAVENGDLAIHGAYIEKLYVMDLILAWAVCATSNSNTITLVNDRKLIGNGVGQQSRVRAARLALYNATDSGHNPEGSVAWSDSFFPFPDGPEELIRGGVKVIFATSGSQNDRLTVDACAKNGVTLLMIPDRLARGFFGHGC